MAEAKEPFSIGTKLGLWTVVSTVLKHKGKRYQACKCVCGTRKLVQVSHLRREKSLSCGCTRAARAAELNSTHGLTHLYAYSSWAMMCNRCNNPNAEDYDYYGGRGITICERWKKFENFFDDMGERSKLETLEREDNNGNYCLENCKWASRKDQGNNTRRNRFLTFNNETLTVSQWADKLNVPYHRLSNRIKKNWPVEDILRCDRHFR